MKTSTKKTFIKDLSKEFIFHEDARHGWLQVPYQLLVDLKIHTKISECSYRNENMVYLEEDVDFEMFLNAYGNYLESFSNLEAISTFWGEGFKRNYEDSSSIRNFDRYYIT